jgi:hypothetical protein
MLNKEHHDATVVSVRTTVTIADDVAAELERLRRDEGLGPSEALNTLARRGMARRSSTEISYHHRPAPLGLTVDVSNIGEVLDLLDGDESGQDRR